MGSLGEAGAAAAAATMVFKVRKRSCRVRTYGNGANLLDGMHIFPLLTPSHIKTLGLRVRDFKQ